jgi:putative intracellular protease/amidase
VKAVLPSNRHVRALAVRIGFVPLAIVAIACGGAPPAPDTMSSAPTPDPRGRRAVLVVLSSDNVLPLKGGKSHPTGYFLNEVMVPVRAILDAGFDVVITTPKGNAPVMDPRSDSARYFADDPARLEASKALRDQIPTFRTPEALDRLPRGGLDRYVGVFVPGGHAPMGDLLENRELGMILRHFHEKHRATGLLCHGPVALIAATSAPREAVSAIESGRVDVTSRLATDWPYAGYHMTVFSTAEERSAERSIGGEVLFYPEDGLRALGGVVEVAPPGKSHVVVDRELVTGQQPASDEEFARAFVGALTGS